MVTYVLTTLGSFGVVLLLAGDGFESDEIKDLAGLNQRSPLYAGVMTVCLLSLAGIPPLVGFQAKLVVLQSLLQTGNTIYLGLAIFAVLMSLIAAFYYIRVIKVMYFDKPADTPHAITAGFDVRSVLTVNGLLILLLGIFPGGLLTLCLQAVHSLFQ
jgi:NADH-quinone oxidoreductase subunit N